MRGTTPGLGTPRPIAGVLPALLGQDDFVQRMCAGLDDVLAPVFASLDSFAAYLDPRTTPEDMLAWLATWIGVELQAGESPERCRERVVAGAEMMGRRGTARGVAAAVESVFGVVPEIVESGGATWSARSGAAMPGSPGARMLVRIRVADATGIDLIRLDALVADVKPAHMAHTIEVEGDPAPEPPAPDPAILVVRPVPPARTWAPSVVFVPGIPAVSFAVHEEAGTRSVDGPDVPSGDSPRDDDPSGAAPSGDATSDQEGPRP